VFNKKAGDYMRDVDGFKGLIDEAVAKKNAANPIKPL